MKHLLEYLLAFLLVFSGDTTIVKNVNNNTNIIQSEDAAAKIVEYFRTDYPDAKQIFMLLGRLSGVSENISVKYEKEFFEENLNQPYFASIYSNCDISEKYYLQNGSVYKDFISQVCEQAFSELNPVLDFDSKSSLSTGEFLSYLSVIMATNIEVENVSANASQDLPITYNAARNIVKSVLNNRVGYFYTGDIDNPVQKNASELTYSEFIKQQLENKNATEEEILHYLFEGILSGEYVLCGEAFGALSAVFGVTKELADKACELKTMPPLIRDMSLRPEIYGYVACAVPTLTGQDRLTSGGYQIYASCRITAKDCAKAVIRMIEDSLFDVDNVNYEELCNQLEIYGITVFINKTSDEFITWANFEVLITEILEIPAQNIIVSSEDTYFPAQIIEYSYEHTYLDIINLPSR